MLFDAPVYPGDSAFGGLSDGIVHLPIWPSHIAFALDVPGAFELGLLSVVFVFLFVDLFDTAGTLIGLGLEAKLLDERGELPRSDRAFLSDAIATSVGALLGTSSTTSYIESASGIEEGGRTGPDFGRGRRPFPREPVRLATRRSGPGGGNCARVDRRRRDDDVESGGCGLERPPCFGARLFNGDRNAADLLDRKRHLVWNHLLHPRACRERSSAGCALDDVCALYPPARSIRVFGGRVSGVIVLCDDGQEAKAGQERQGSPRGRASTPRADSAKKTAEKRARPDVRTIRRHTKETEVNVALDLDGSGRAQVDTGVPFFDHMLEALAKHSLIDLQVLARGDLEVDPHHTVEDVGLCIGRALVDAVGDRSGMVRYGEATLPFDETLVRCYVDLCGRPAFVYRVEIPAGRVGSFDAELSEVFFGAVASEGRMNLHLILEYGTNRHHIIEGCFKSLARALRSSGADRPAPSRRRRVDQRQPGLSSKKRKRKPAPEGVWGRFNPPTPVQLQFLAQSFYTPRARHARFAASANLHG